jgi:alkylhydroperoxidase family enzyme
VGPRLPLPDDTTASPALAAEYEAAREREGSVMAILRALGPRAVAELRAHLSDAEAYDAIAVVGLLNLANRAALATGITAADDLL